MPMRITCPNCGKQFSAWDDLVGKSVECPKCHQKTVIAGPNEALGPAPPSSPAGKPPAASRPAAPAQPVKPRPAAAAPAPSSAKPQPAPKPAAAKPHPVGVGRPPQPPPPPAVRVSPKPVTSPPQPAPDAEFDDDDSLPNGCPNCNATMAPNDDLCDACGYHLILKKVIDISEMPKKNSATGFERMLQGQLNDPDATSSTWLWVKIAASVILVGILVVCLGQWWWVGVIGFAGIAALWWWKQKQSGGEGGSSTVNQDPVSSLIWAVLLGVQRVVGWRNLSPPFAKTRTLILCDPNFDDRELAGLDGLADFETLDLEGTGITDGAIDQLKTLKQLRFLVVRRTQITPAGVRRLQQDLPKVMIWV